ncbi:MAG: hypothetical protein HY860_00625 [Chlamydiales bacterium]|nr:hypothetical protein [Chlamydiales bacterium]
MDSPSQNGIRSTIEAYFLPPLSAIFAISPVYRDFVRKTKMQLGESYSPLSFKHIVTGSVKAGSILGVQIIAEQWIRENWVPKTSTDCPLSDRVLSASMSCAFVGAASIIPLTLFQGFTSGLTMSQSWGRLNIGIATALFIRESIFLGLVQTRDPICQSARKHIWDHPIIGYSALAITTAFTSIANHPWDTTAARLLEGKSVKSWQTITAKDVPDFMKGSLFRSRGAAAFIIAYTIAEETLRSRLH